MRKILDQLLDWHGQGEEIALATIDELKPALVRAVGVEDFLYLLMPVRVS